MKKIVGIIVCMLLIVNVVSSISGIELIEKSSIITLHNDNTLYVGGSGPGNYTSIQEAIDDAEDGDTIYVYNGTYYENLEVNKSINLMGESKNTTFIDGNKSGHVAIIEASDVIISGFTMRNADYSVFGAIFVGSSNNTIRDNIISDNSMGGIGMFYSFNNTITDNIISNNDLYGIALMSSYDAVISENEFSNNHCGIFLYTNNSTIYNNSFSNDGLFVLDPLFYNNVSNNTVNGKPLVYLEDESDKVIEEDAGQVILISCYNITVKNQDLSNVSVGVQLLGTDKCLVFNNSIQNNQFGIWTYASFNDIISDNTIASNNYSGVVSISSFHNVISNNIINNNNRNLFILEDIISYYLPFNISGSVTLCTCVNNSISGNIISGSDIHGLSLVGSHRNIVSENTISSNNRNGVILVGSCANRIYNNNFIDNQKDAFFCSAYRNKWKGNYWNEARSFPKPIFGRINPGTIKFKFSIPWMNFDWKPAQEPYEV